MSVLVIGIGLMLMAIGLLVHDWWMLQEQGRRAGELRKLEATVRGLISQNEESIAFYQTLLAEFARTQADAERVLARLGEHGVDVEAVKAEVKATRLAVRDEGAIVVEVQVEPP